MLQQTPLAVTAEPPSLVISPPDIPPEGLGLVKAVVVRVANEFPEGVNTISLPKAVPSLLLAKARR